MMDAQEFINTWVEIGQEALMQFKIRPKVANPTQTRDRYFARLKLQNCRSDMPAESRKHFAAKREAQ